MPTPRPRTPSYRPFTFPATTEGEAWLERLEREQPKQTPCCARCRRGTKALGAQPCGYADRRTGCPNPNCAHNKENR